MAIVRVVLAVLGLVALLPGAAHGASADVVTMFSDGDYIGGGLQRVHTPANGEITVGGSTGYLSVGVSGGAYGDSFDLEFAAPLGHVLAPGVYDKAQRAPFREATRPGIDISGDGRGCNEVSGRFEVKELAVGSGGVLQRLWIVYEHTAREAPRACSGRCGSAWRGRQGRSPALRRSCDGRSRTRGTPARRCR